MVLHLFSVVFHTQPLSSYHLHWGSRPRELIDTCQSPCQFLFGDICLVFNDYICQSFRVSLTPIKKKPCKTYKECDLTTTSAETAQKG